MSKIVVVGAGSRRDEIIEELKAKPIILDGAIFDSLEDLEIEFVEDTKDYPSSNGLRLTSMFFDEFEIEKETKLQEKLLKNKSYQEQQRDLRFISKRKKK